MKTLSAILMTLALSLVVPLHAQKYHDAIIEGATGPVKSIQQDRYVVRFNEDGEMTYRCGWMGDEEYFEVTRNRDSYPSYLTIYTDKEHNDSHTLKEFIYSGKGNLWMVTYRSKGVVKTGAITYNHDYERKGILTGFTEKKTYRTDNSHEEIYATYSNVVYDQYGNWTSRDVTKKSSKHGTSKERETRTITYYPTATQATAQPQPSQNGGSIYSSFANLMEKNLRGAWKLQRWTYDGRSVDFSQSKEQVVFGDNRTYVWQNKGDGDTNGTYKIEFIDRNSARLTMSETSITFVVKLYGNRMTWKGSDGTIRAFTRIR